MVCSTGIGEETKMKIYRVCTLSKVDEKIEASIGNLPGWRNSFTGFWTTSFQEAKSLLDARNEAAVAATNGLSWSVIVETDIENVVIDDDHEKYKVSHDSKYDSHELFVLKIRDESKIKLV